MRVLIVIPDLAPATGGPVTTVLGLAGALAVRGHAVAIATTDFGLDVLPTLNGVDFHVFPCLYASRRWSPRLCSFLRREVTRYDLVSVHTLWQFPTWAAAAACRAAGVRYVVTPHGMLEAWSLSQKAWKKQAYAAFVEGKTIRTAAALHFTAEAERVGSRTFGSRAPAYVVPLGLSRSAYEDLPAPGVFRRRFPELVEKQLILFLGRLHYKKRPDVALLAFSEVAREFPDAVLVLAGPGEARYVSDLQAEVQRLGLDGQVVFTGLLQGRAVQEALVDADIFVLPSLHENFGLAVAEAMAAGCPVVVSPEVALAPDIEKYGAGVVVDGEVDGLRHVLRQLLKDENRRHAMGQNGRQLILDQFTRDRVAQQMVEVYEDILRGTRTSSAWR
ncbi:MAG: glycosyltransferase [candidate division NC10 bacterium]|nr:glycosyltransferase [candidate division NC10 bacterium]